jgi:hypothetical protein
MTEPKLSVRGRGNPNCPICNRQPRQGTWEHARWLMQQSKPVRRVVPVVITELEESK